MITPVVPEIVACVRNQNHIIFALLFLSLIPVLRINISIE
jgi:hypothetical protein